MSLDAVWFVVGCFEGFVSPPIGRGKSLTKPSHTEDAPYLKAENSIMEASAEELASCSLAFCEEVENDQTL